MASGSTTTASDQPSAVSAGGWAAVLRRRPPQRWCWGTRLVVTATVAWLLFLVTHLLVSGRTWLWAPVDLIPPVLLVAVPAVLLVIAPFARPVRWRLMTALVLAGLLGAGGSGINLATLWHTPPPAPAHAISVAAWNTEFWEQGLDQESFYRYLLDLDADIYLLQEYLHWDWERNQSIRVHAIPKLRREFPDHQVAVGGGRVTLSRFPIVWQGGLDLRPELPEKWQRVPESSHHFPTDYTTEVLRTDIQVAGTIVSFYNTHIFQPPVDLRLHRGEAREANRYHQARRVASFRTLAKDIADNRHPVVVFGDLNSSPAMGLRRMLPERLVDHTRVLPSVYPTSWRDQGIDPHLGGLRQLLLWRLDWLLTTSDVVVHRYEFFRSAGLSDHSAQRSVLSLDG